MQMGFTIAHPLRPQMRISALLEAICKMFAAVCKNAQRRREGLPMEEEIILGRDETSEVFKRFLSQFDAPAYIRRARGVQAALEQLLDHCRRRRAEWLEMVRLRIGMLHALAGEWENLRPFLVDDDQLDILRYVLAALAVPLRAPMEVTLSARVLRQALRELCESLERFNQRWRAFLASLDLGAVNELREGYNRYYVLEKECAVRSPRVARQGFVPLQPLTLDEISEQFPLLPVPQLR